MAYQGMPTLSCPYTEPQGVMTSTTSLVLNASRASWRSPMLTSTSESLITPIHSLKEMEVREQDDGWIDAIFFAILL